MAFPTSQLSQENVLRDIHDPVTQSIRTTANAIIAPGLQVSIDQADDSIKIGDGINLITSTGDGLKRGLDVHISNVSPIDVTLSTPLALGISAADGDSILLVGTEDGLLAGTQHVLKIGSDLNLRVKDEDANTTLTAINNKITTTVNGIEVDGDFLTDAQLRATPINVNLPTGASTSALQTTGNNLLTSIDNKTPALGQAAMTGSVPVVFASDQSPLNIDLEALATSTPDNVLVVGSIDGTKTATKYALVNNLKQQILATHDREADFTYADFGTKNQRITRIDYSSATFPGTVVRRDFSYTLVGNNYRRDDEIWTIV